MSEVKHSPGPVPAVTQIRNVKSMGIIPGHYARETDRLAIYRLSLDDGALELELPVKIASDEVVDVQDLLLMVINRYRRLAGLKKVTLQEAQQ